MDRKEGRIARSVRLCRVAWRLVRGDRTMLTLALMSAVFTGLAMFVLFYFGGYLHDPHPSRGRLLLVTLIAAWPLTFIGAFINVALAAAADAELHGRQISLRRALAVPAGRVGQIALWSLLAAGVGQLLAQIGERIPFGGRVASWLLGAAWGLVTFFAVPVLAIEGCTAAGCVKRSARLVRERWGESVAGGLGISAVFVLLSIVPSFLLGAGFSIAPVAPAVGIPLAAAGIVGLVVVFGAASALRNVYAVALYHYATGAGPTGGFPEQDLEHPFTRRRRGLFGRS
jgi:hypothetical protein